LDGNHTIIKTTYPKLGQIIAEFGAIAGLILSICFISKEFSSYAFFGDIKHIYL